MPQGLHYFYLFSPFSWEQYKNGFSGFETFRQKLGNAMWLT
jgi:hypothetical protein